MREILLKSTQTTQGKGFDRLQRASGNLKS